jgi:hypothetical protein
LITKMEVFSQLHGAPALPLGDFDSLPPNDAPLQIRHIDGLGPVKADISSAPMALTRGVFFQGSSTGQRNIVLTLGLAPKFSEGQTLGTLRQQVYRYFMPELGATLKFYSPDISDSSVHIDGFVESVEPNIFSQDPEMQVSLLCPRPDFISDEEILMGPFPASDYDTEIEYVGSVSNGFNSVEIHNPYSYYTGQIEVSSVNGTFNQDLKIQGAKIDPGRYVHFSTVPTRRRVQSISETTGVVTSIMGHVTKDSGWPELQPGTNIVKIMADSTGPEWTLSYFNRYGGL